MKLVVPFFIIVLSFNSFANDLDQNIGRYIDMFNLAVPKKISNTDPKKYEFGKKLFKDPKLSLSNNISCHTCHSVDFGSSDALPFSIGTGGIGEGSERLQKQAEITPRSSPHLFNKGHKSVKTMFWDGRVRFSSNRNEYTTPEPGLNGQDPSMAYIRDKIENVMAMQALFPMVNPAEMLGKRNRSLTNEQAWSLIAKRVKNDPSYATYISKFKDFNIADIANALSYFQTIRFQVNDTPFDKYISGDLKSLSEIEKRGAEIFLNKARCVRCHNGPLLSNNAFQSVAAPQIGEGITQDKDDLGFFHGSNEPRGKYLFKTQPLRNVALTAPYMHNGSLVDLSAVVLHYNDPAKSLKEYNPLEVNRKYFNNFKSEIFHDSREEKNLARINALAPVIRRPLGLSSSEQKDLICFLKKSLTQIKLHQKLDLSECTN